MSSSASDTHTHGRPNGACSICGTIGRLQRGWCERHYARWKRHGTPEPEGLRAAPGSKERWLVEVQATAGEECIEWPGHWARHAFGYGVLSVAGSQVEAHRFVCGLRHGERQPGAQCRHLCGNPACVNGRHLAWGSVVENSADRRRHGRSGRKLTEADVAAIRADPRMQKVIAAAYGVSQPLVSQIKRGVAWRPTES